MRSINDTLIQCTGILHVGAHEGEEAGHYDSLGKAVVWIEADPLAFSILARRIDALFPNQLAINALVTDVDGDEYEFNRSSNNGGSSSIYEFGEYASGDHSLWPELNLHMVETIRLASRSLDSLYQEYRLDKFSIDLLRLDIQGAELLALKGATRLLQGIQFIIVQISCVEIYKNGARWKDIKSYLSARGFVHVGPAPNAHEDVVFVNRSNHHSSTVRPPLLPSPSCQIPDLVAIYLDLFGTCLGTEGTFVEIGASDGESHSNTSCLADIGWRGIYVEPLPKQADKCALRHSHNKVAVICAAVSDFSGETAIRVAGELSTIQAHHADAFEKLPWAKEHFASSQWQVVPVITPIQLWSQIADFIGSHVDLLVIDCEGSEEPVLKTMDLDIWDPKVIIIELRHEDPDFEQFPEIQMESRRVDRILIDAGYHVYWKDRLNYVYVR